MNEKEKSNKIRQIRIGVDPSDFSCDSKKNSDNETKNFLHFILLFIHVSISKNFLFYSFTFMYFIFLSIKNFLFKNKIFIF